MQIVINISEESYKNIKEQVDKRDYPDMQIGRAIADGTPLPKGHGRLKDADAMIKRITNLTKCSNGYSKVYDETMIINIISNELTIIEADEAESEDKE